MSQKVQCKWRIRRGLDAWGTASPAAGPRDHRTETLFSINVGEFLDHSSIINFWKRTVFLKFRIVLVQSTRKLNLRSCHLQCVYSLRNAQHITLPTTVRVVLGKLIGVWLVKELPAYGRRLAMGWSFITRVIGIASTAEYADNEISETKPHCNECCTFGTC